MINPKTILITGATSGFGKAIAQKFAEGGFQLILTGRRAERLAQLKEQLSPLADVQTLCFDIRDRPSVIESIGSLKEQTIDILVNNAGLASGLSTIDEGDDEDWDWMIDTNIKGLLNVSKQVIPFLKRSKGHIINIGSTAGKLVYKNGNVYCATKFAVDALSQAMRIDLLEHGIKVSSINPGMAETEFSLVRFKGDEERAKSVYKGFKALQAEDIADIVWFVVQQPAHVCINDLTVTCTTQANGFYAIKNA